MYIIRRILRFEFNTWRSLFLWATRRVAGRRPGAEAFSYGREAVPLTAVFVFLSLIELPVVHLLIPWDTVRLVTLVISVWGLLWMLGLLASLKVFPHLLDEEGLRIRYGYSVDVRIPWEAVAGVASRRGSVPTSKHVHLEPSDGGVVLSVPAVKQTRVEVALREPTTVELPQGREVIVACRLYVDDPRAFVERARERLAC